MTDESFSAEEQRWLRVWDERVQQVAAGALTPNGLFEWAWRDKVLNAINVTIQRIKRSERPGSDPRRHDNTWVTVAAERGSRKEDLSTLAFQTLAFVYERLKDRGHDFHVDWMATTNGVIVVSINVRSLREFMKQRTEATAGQ